MLHTFDINNAALTIGSYSISSFASGNAFEVEVDDDNWEIVSGTGGAVTRARKNNNVATAKIRLDVGNDANVYLAKLEKSDRENGTGVVTLLFREYNGNGRVQAQNAFVTKHAAQSYGDSPEVIEWELKLVGWEITPSSLNPA